MASEKFSNVTLIGIEAALLAGEILRQGFGTHFSISTKSGIHNLVTEYDHRAENAIIQFISQNLPSSRFLAEESGDVGESSSELLWIVDPLDGTVNFAHQIPFFAVSIAAQKEGRILSGVVYQPMTHELFVAEKDVGAFVNGNRLKVTPTSDLMKAFIATGFPYNLSENPLGCIDHLTDVLRLGLPIRRLGVAALDLSYTAAGRFDAFFEVALAPWDCAAGVLLVEEAGGKVSHWDGTPFDLFSNKPMLASNGLIHKQLAAVLHKK